MRQLRDEHPLVLIVDDDPILRELARAALEHEGYAVAEATTGVEGIQRFEELRPALLLLDIHMDQMDGLTACRALRRRHPDDTTPIVFMTGTDDRQSVDDAYQAGGTDFIGKPINLALLPHRMRYLLRGRNVVTALRASEASLARAQRIARLGSWECSEDFSRMSWSDETYRILGLTPGAEMPTLADFLHHVHPQDRERVRGHITDAMNVSKVFHVEHRILRPDGTTRHVQQQGELVLDRVWGMHLSATIQDVTEQRLAQEKIQHLANFDSLTGLSNRNLFKDRLARAIDAARERGHLTALLYMDLDRFKRINDTLGHSAGDQLLKHVSCLLVDKVRHSDVVARLDGEPPERSISRLGGDEFTILLAKLSEPSDAGDVARRILEALPEPISIDGHEMAPTGSIGIALYPQDGEDGETLLKHADTAMYAAKERGRNNYQFFSDRMNRISLRKLTLEARLRAALENGELALHYQPRVSLDSGLLVGAEALLRWSDPELGDVSPREIVPVAEETGLIVAVGAWALHAACQQSRAWQDAGHDPIRISVNVSRRQFAHHDLRDTVAEALSRSRIEPSQLELEITESVVMQDDEATALVLRDLQAMGVGIALDDFGTGYSSLSYLTRFPLDVLKMDRCFVRDVHRDPAAAGVAAAVISMAHCLGARVVAEGVDDEAQRDFLREHRCDEIQGFLVSGALPPDDMLAELARARRGGRLSGC